MLDPFQSSVLQVLAANRSTDSFVADGAALNRDGPRQSRDIDIFHTTVALIDAAVARDLNALRRVGWQVQRDRGTSTLREWTVFDSGGQATKIQWTRDTSWLFFPCVADPEFGFMLSFEDLAVNKMSAAADRGRRRDYHDLAALDLLGAHPWLLALAVMDKDAELSPEAVLERALRLLRDAGDDDEDPDYAGPSLSWTAVRARMSRRLREDLATLRGFRWLEWAGALPLDAMTGRMALGITSADLAACVKGRASPTGTWPTILAASSDMLRHARHPSLAGVSLDLSGHEAAWLADGAQPL